MLLIIYRQTGSDAAIVVFTFTFFVISELHITTVLHAKDNKTGSLQIHWQIVTLISTKEVKTVANNRLLTCF